jgi:hypothetical protein
LRHFKFTAVKNKGSLIPFASQFSLEYVMKFNNAEEFETVLLLAHAGDINYLNENKYQK